MTSTRFARPRAPLSPFAPLAVAVLLSACGGGGGGSGDALASCRAEAASLGLEFEFYQQLGGCRPDIDDEPLPTVVDRGPEEGEEPDVPVPTLAEFPAAAEFDPSFADVSGGGFYTNTVNTALLQGPPIVPEGFDGDAATRALPFLVGRTGTGLALRYVGTPEESDRSADLFAVVENIGSERRCFVDLDGLVVLDTNGAEVRVFGLGGSFVDGGLMTVLGITVGGCLEAGEKGHTRFSVDAPSSDVAAVFVTDLTSNPSANAGPDAQVEAVSYDVVGDDLVVTVANRGSRSVRVTRVIAYLIDAEGRAIAEDLTGGPDDPIAAGAEAIVDLDIDSLNLTGRVTTVRVILEYDFGTDDD